MEQQPQTSDTPDIEAIYQDALRFVKEGRWSEAKIKIEAIEQIDADYRNVANLKSMVEEVMQTSMFGFGAFPPHLASARGPSPEHYVADEEEEDDDEPFEPARPSRSNRIWLIVGALVVVAVIVALVYFRR